MVEAMSLNVAQLESLRVNHEADTLHRVHRLEDDLLPQFREMEEEMHQLRSDHLRHIEEEKVERERWESRMVRRLEATSIDTGSSLALHEGLMNDMLERMLDMKQQVESVTDMAQAGPSQPSRQLVQEKPASAGHPVRALQPSLEQEQDSPVHLPSPDLRRIHYGAAAIRNGRGGHGFSQEDLDRADVLNGRRVCDVVGAKYGAELLQQDVQTGLVQLETDEMGLTREREEAQRPGSSQAQQSWNRSAKECMDQRDAAKAAAAGKGGKRSGGAAKGAAMFTSSLRSRPGSSVSSTQWGHGSAEQLHSDYRAAQEFVQVDQVYIALVKVRVTIGCLRKGETMGGPQMSRRVRESQEEGGHLPRGSVRPGCLGNPLCPGSCRAGASRRIRLGRACACVATHLKKGHGLVITVWHRRSRAMRAQGGLHPQWMPPEYSSTRVCR
jgi:hypothetical protein